MSEGGSGGKLSRMQVKLDSALQSGQYYEAHQLYRTFYYRMVAQKKFEEVLDLLYSGAIGFFEKKQSAIAVDLSELFADTLCKAEWPVSDDRMMDRVQDLFSRAPSAHTPTAAVSHFGTNLMAACSSTKSDKKQLAQLDEVASTAIDRNKFFNSLLTWSKSVSTERRGSAHGDSRLHKRLANVYWNEKRYESARYHFLMSTDAEGTALFLIDYHTLRGYRNEVDLFVAQIVFQYLCHSDKRTASSVFYTYTASHPQIQQAEPPYKLPLLNFVWLLLLCIDLKQVTYYSILVEKYQSTLKRDPNYNSYLDKIGQIFFGLPAPVKKKQGGFLQNILQGLMGGGGASTSASAAPVDLVDNDDDFHSVTSDQPEMIDMEHDTLD